MERRVSCSVIYSGIGRSVTSCQFKRLLGLRLDSCSTVALTLMKKWSIMNKKAVGCVRKRGDTQKYIIDYDDNLGNRHREIIGTNPNDAMSALREKLKQNFVSEVSGFNASNQTFKDYVDKWIGKKLSLKDATRVSYEGILANHLKPYFGEGQITDIRRDNIQNFVKKLTKDGLSPKTINNTLMVLHQILDDMVIDGLIAESPYKKIERPRIEKAEVDCLETHEIQLFLDACSDTEEDPQNYPLFYTAIFTGMRRGGLLGLRWGDIDCASKKIHVRKSLYKGKLQEPKSEHSKRKIDMGPRLIEVLKAHRKRRIERLLKMGKQLTNDDLVFSQPDGNSLDGDNLYHRDFKRILKRAGLRQMRIHDLRHTFASILINAGHNLKYIQNQMAHAKIEITFNLYGHLLNETLEGAAQKTEDSVFKPCCPAPVPTKKEGVTNESQPLEMLGSGG
jgi:integrase